MSEVKPAWLVRAENERDISEIPGAKHNPRIVEYFEVCTYKAKEDEVPWCAAFVSSMLEWSRVRSTRSAAAKSYLNWGREIEAPTIGCIVVTTRPGGTKEKPLYHVGFFVGKSDTGIFILSGNYRNTVCTAEFSESRVVSYREPTEFLE
jgi:uncharacterized protein (TIGR02594 family)